LILPPSAVRPSAVVVVAVGGEEDDAQSRDGESLGCVREKGREDSEWRGRERDRDRI
jgi:hypothetical protein